MSKQCAKGSSHQDVSVEIPEISISGNKFELLHWFLSSQICEMTKDAMVTYNIQKFIWRPFIFTV